MTQFPDDFLWGASTSPHQTEGNNVNSDWWVREQIMPGAQPSGDAVDSYHRYPEDMRLLADAGLTAYRFGIEWARVEPLPGRFSRAALAHYRRMIETALGLGLTPVVTLHHFSIPRWFEEEGGWLGETAIDRFTAYVRRAAEILDGVNWVITMNEPNMLALIDVMAGAVQAGSEDEWHSPTLEREGAEDRGGLPTPRVQTGQRFVAIHHAARAALREVYGGRIGWSIANQALTAEPGGEARLEELRYAWEDVFLDGAAGDDFVGVQSYSSQAVDARGIVPHPQDGTNTLSGASYRPDALGLAVAHTAQRTGLPILVTENGIATADDERRTAYTESALAGLAATMDAGADVRGYLHWSLLDNYEWGHWEPTFGLVAVDRETFERTPKPSLAWLGQQARTAGAGLRTASGADA